MLAFTVITAFQQVEFLSPLIKDTPAALGPDNSHALYGITSTATAGLQAWVGAPLKDLSNFRWSIIIGKLKPHICSNNLIISDEETTA